LTALPPPELSPIMTNIPEIDEFIIPKCEWVQIESCIAQIDALKRCLAYNLKHGRSIDSDFYRNCTDRIARTEGFLAEHMANLTALGYSSVEDFLTKYKALKST